MSELTKKRVHWTEYNGDELLHDEDVDVLTSADAVTFDDGEDLQYKYTKGQFVNPSVTGSLASLSTINKSTLVDAINEVKANATSNESSIESLTDRVSTTEIDIDALESRMDTAESEIDGLENRMGTAESGIDDLESRITPISLGGTGATTETSAISNFKTALVDLLYPVGSIHMSVNSANPSTYFGGTWVSWGAGRVPVGVNTSDSSFSSVEKTGGAKTHKLTVNEMPSHTHTDNINTASWGAGVYSAHCNIDVYEGTTDSNELYFHIGATSDATGGNAAHNNLQPYITCYMWKRTE